MTYKIRFKKCPVVVFSSFIDSNKIHCMVLKCYWHYHEANDMLSCDVCLGISLLCFEYYVTRLDKM